MNVIVIYATITGNNEAIADILIEQFKKKNISVKKSEISQTDSDDLRKYDLAIICPYTYDLGSIPSEGYDFFDDLLQVDLSNLNYLVIGSGDTFYGEKYYGSAVDLFDQQMEKANANRIHQKIKIDRYPDENDKLLLIETVNKLI